MWIWLFGCREGLFFFLGGFVEFVVGNLVREMSVVVSVGML